MLPTTEITKIDGQTGVVRPSSTGVCAIVAPAPSGTANIAATYARSSQAVTDYGKGRLTELAAYVMPASGHPAVLVRCDTTTEGAYGTITDDVDGTSAITAGSSKPVDDFDVEIDFPAGGTVGTAGITYRYSLDGGKTRSKALALGTANSITIPDSGVSIALGAGTIVAGDKVSFSTTAPQPTDADLPDALEALRVTSSPWECVLIDQEADDSTVSLVSQWLATLNAKGKFPTAILTARRRDVATETEAQYATALQAIFDAAASTDIVVCADLADIVSTIRGITMRKPVGMFVAGRGMRNPLGRDVAYVADGPLYGSPRITDARNNPKYHDEAKYPGLDDLRLATLRTFEDRQGVYITNAPLLSSNGSDYVYWQHARVINRGCEIAYSILTGQLSAGVDKKPGAGPNNERYIAEKDAQRIEELVNANLYRELIATGQCADIKFTLSRTDDISSNAGATLTGAVESVALAYVKKFSVTAGFVKQIGG